MAEKDPYSVLGVSRGADDDEIKSAYRKLTKLYHPDLHPGDASAASKMSEINAAYDRIKDADARRRYDDSLNIHQGSPYGSYGQNPGYYGQYTSGYGPYGQNSGSYGHGSYSQQSSSDGSESGPWVFTPFGAFKMGGGSYRTEQTTYGGEDQERREQYSYTYRRRRFSILRYIFLIILLNSLLRMCGAASLWRYYGSSPNFSQPENQSQSYGQPVGSGQNM